MAFGGDPGNVTLGPGRLYAAPLGTAEPVTCSSAVPSAWYSIGYTEDGHAVSTETTSEEVNVAEELDPIRYENVKRIGQVVFSMAETTRRNLALAQNNGAGQPNGTDPIEPPDLGSEIRIMLLWDSEETPSETNRRWLFRQCYQSGTAEIARRKAPQKSLIPVTFRLEKPTTGLKLWRAFPNVDGLI